MKPSLWRGYVVGWCPTYLDYLIIDRYCLSFTIGFWWGLFCFLCCLVFWFDFALCAQCWQSLGCPFLTSLLVFSNIIYLQGKKVITINRMSDQISTSGLFLNIILHRNNGSQTEKQLRQYNTAIFTILYKNHFEYYFLFWLLVLWQ